MNKWSEEVKTGTCALGVWFLATGNSGNIDNTPLLIRRSSGKSWNDQFYRQRIINEAEILKTLASLNTTVVPDLISFNETADEAVLCVEAYDRRTVKSLVKKKKLSIEDTLYAAEVIAETLKLFHRRNCIHNYICPWTISIEQDGDPVFTDLSLAEFGKVSQHEKLPEEIPLEEILPYLPPETVKREPTTCLSDIYQLGCLLYYCFTGQPPWSGEDYVKIVAKGTGTPPPPSSINSLVTPSLDSLILEMLSIEPSRRPKISTIIKKMQNHGSEKATSAKNIPPTTNTDQKKFIIPLIAVIVLIISGGLWSFLPGDNDEGNDIFSDPDSGPTVIATKKVTPSQITSTPESNQAGNSVQSKNPLPPATTNTTPQPAKDYSKVKDPSKLPANELFTIAIAFHQGLGGREQSLEKAVYYYGLAAGKGDANAQNNLAYCLLIGEGVDENFEHGRAWLGESVKAGTREAILNLAQLYYRGIVGSPSPEKAIELIKGRTKANDALALYHLGIAYTQAKSITRHNEKAVKAFRESAQIGFPPALIELARHYEKGKGTKKNPEQADICRQQAAIFEKQAKTEFNTKLLLVLRARSQTSRSVSKNKERHEKK